MPLALYFIQHTRASAAGVTAPIMAPSQRAFTNAVRRCALYGHCGTFRQPTRAPVESKKEPRVAPFAHSCAGLTRPSRRRLRSPPRAKLRTAAAEPHACTAAPAGVYRAAAAVVTEAAGSASRYMCTRAAAWISNTVMVRLSMTTTRRQRRRRRRSGGGAIHAGRCYGSGRVALTAVATASRCTVRREASSTASGTAAVSCSTMAVQMPHNRCQCAAPWRAAQWQRLLGG